MITFRKLELAHFRGIDSASVEFTPGLNILYGPNELGKSSLLVAIRAALLLPVTSSEAKDYKTWGSLSVPTVTLYFCVNEIEYRVYKPFATGNRSNALLDRINGSEAFNMARGAKVDSELRKLIEWGIPEPGRGAPRGLPQSYLSNALLGMQDEVEQVLRTDLSEDKSDSGIHTLTKALGTIGKDPLTSTVIDTLESRTAKVFTPTGQIRRTGDSPLNQLTIETRVATRELEALQRDLRESQDVEASMESLRGNAIRCEEEQRALEKYVELTRRAQAAEDSLQEFQEKQKHVQATSDSYQEQKTALQTLQADFDHARTTADQTEKELRSTESKLTGIAEKLKSIDAVSSSQAAAQKSKLTAEISSIKAEIERLQVAQATEGELRQLRADRESVDDKLNIARQLLTNAEQQHHYLKLLYQQQDYQNTIESLKQAKTTRDAAEQEANKLQKESNHLRELTDQTSQLLSLRSSLDETQSNESELTHARALRREAQNQLDRANQTLQQNTVKTNTCREQVQQLQQQLAATQARQQSQSETAHTATQSRQQLLQNTIETAKQRIVNAESALDLQREISETERYIDQIKNDLTAGKRHLDRATSEVKRRNTTNAKPRSRSSQGQEAPAKRTSPTVGIALTVVASLACLVSWLGDFFSAGLIATPVVAVIGLFATFLTQRSGQRKHSHYDQRRDPGFDNEHTSDHERLGLSADELRRGSDRLAAAEGDLQHLRQRYAELTGFLNAEPYDVVEQENRKILQSQDDLEHPDQQHTDEIHKLQQQMLELEHEINQLNNDLDILTAEHARLQADQQTAQSNLASFDAKIDHLIKINHLNPAEIEAEFASLANTIQSKTELSLDRSTVESIQNFKQALEQNSSECRQQLNTATNKVATYRAEVQNMEQSSPEEKLAELNTTLTEVKSQQPANTLSDSVTIEDSQRAIEQAQANIDTEKSHLSNIDGQISAKQNTLPAEPSAVTSESLTELQSELVARQTSLKESDANATGQRAQLESDKSDLEENKNTLYARLEQEKLKQKNLEEKLTTSKEEIGRTRGILQELESTQSAIDVESAEAAINKAIAESNGQINRNSSLIDQLNLFSKQLENAKAQTADRQKELNQHRGKLDMIGGAVLEDRVRRQTETCDRLQSEAHDLEKQSKAEKYLLEVLKEEDEKHTDHLGRVLAKPVSAKFNELTGNRYGTFILDPQLTAQTINAEGDAREYEQLSIGTRQQLAVLVKLALAAQLKSTVVLDDQLVHSDPERQIWFRDALQASVRDFAHQVIVLTCRPDDYRSDDANAVNLADYIDRATTT